MRLWRASVRSTSRSRGSSRWATVVITQRGDGSVNVIVAPPSRALRLRQSFSTKPDAASGPVSITRLGRNRRVVIVLSGASVGEGREARGGDEVQRGEVDEALVGGRHGHGQVEGDVGQQDVVDLGPVALVDVVGCDGRLEADRSAEVVAERRIGGGTIGGAHGPAGDRDGDLAGRGVERSIELEERGGDLRLLGAQDLAGVEIAQRQATVARDPRRCRARSR